MTVGKASLELSQKTVETRDPIELEREMHKNYENNVLECVNRGILDCAAPVFYVVVETKKERLMDNVIRNYFFYRLSCPSPSWDQTVYRYTRSDEKIQYLWTIPSKDTCELLYENAIQVASEERQLLQHVLDFKDGTLLRLAKQYNGEQVNSDRLEKE